MSNFQRPAVFTFGLFTSAAAATLASAQTPQLRHSAPFLGHELRLELSGAAPGAWVELFESTLRRDTPTPFGQWELERTAMTRVAFGAADAQGEFTWSWSVPVGWTYTEAPRHYQALVRAPNLTLVSQAVHLRLLGARAYVLSSGSSAPGADIGASLTIASIAQQPRALARIDYDAPLPTLARDAWPAFDASYSRGAVLISPTELSLFDPFFGAELARHTLAPSASRVFTSPGQRETLYAFAPGDPGAGQAAHLQRFDLRTSAQLASTPLPPAEYRASWVANLESSLAYALAIDSAAQQPFVERIDLATGSATGRLDIAAPGMVKLVDTAATDRGVFLLMRSESLPGAWQARLTHIDEAGGLAVRSMPWYGYTSSISAAPAVNLFAAVDGLPSLPGVSLRISHLTGPDLRARSIALPFADVAFRAVLVESGVWVHTWSGDTSGHQLYFRDWTGATEYFIPLSVFPPQIQDVAAFEDALGARACALVREFDPGPTSSSARAKLHVFSQEWSSTWEITVGPGPGSLWCVPIP